VVEDGTIVANADSYTSVTDADTYFTAHGSPATWTAATTAEKEGALRTARQWMDHAFDWKGVIVDDDQVLDWPRDQVYDDEGRAIATTTIPQALKDAQCEAALEHLTSSLSTPVARGGMVKRTKVGPLEKEFMDGAPGGRIRSFISGLLGPYSTSGPGAFRFERA
jgi:hypothetical protein